MDDQTRHGSTTPVASTGATAGADSDPHPLGDPTADAPRTAPYGALPWGFLLAAAVVLAVDAFAFDTSGFWRMLQPRVPATSFLEAGLVSDRIALTTLDRGGPRVFAVGSSRARAAFLPRWRDLRGLRNTRFVVLAHAGIGPFEIDSAMEEILARRPAVVVWLLSEFDTHRPLVLPVAASSGSFPAILDLVREAGAPFAVRQRTTLLRLSMVGMLDGYRYRDVLHRAFVDDARRFQLDDRLPPPRGRRAAVPIPGGPPQPLSGAELRRLRRDLADRFPQGPLTAEIDQVRSITRGEHARVQMGLLERAAHRLRAAGVTLVVCEGPLYPAALALYDTSIREEFLAFASRLASTENVRFIPLEESGPFGEGDFSDLTHVNLAGARKLTAATLGTVRPVLLARSR